MKKIFTFFFIIFLFGAGFSQELLVPQSKFQFLPDGLHFKPLKANPEEARLGILFFPNNSNLKVDIGNSIDLLGISFQQNRISAGIEFMAYGLVSSYKNYQLQIDAIDGFFGGNITFSHKLNDAVGFARLRVIHNSAHLVDGRWDDIEKHWINNATPIAFGRDHIELDFAVDKNTSWGNYRYYAGGSYDYHTFTRFRALEKMSYNTGFEISTKKLLGSVLEKESNLFFAVHLNLRGIPSYIGNQSYILGMKLGNWNNKGIIIYGSYYSGGDIFSEFFNIRTKRLGIGFTVDFI